MNSCYTLDILPNGYLCRANVNGFSFSFVPTEDDVEVWNEELGRQKHCAMKDGAIEKYFNANVKDSAEHIQWLNRPLEG